MDRSNAPGATYPAGANGILTSEGLRQACDHVWRDSNSTTMLGADILNSEPVSYDDQTALTALKRHISVAGPGAFVQDVLPNLGFGRSRMNPVPPAVSPGEETVEKPENGTAAKLPCVKCGEEADPLHLGCRLCEECCDCRPAGT